MSTTTFSGPVKAGNIFNTTGTTLSENLSNQGQATMVQVASLTENVTGDPLWTGIVIPANSQIIRIAVLVTTVFGVKVYVGKGADSDFYVDGFDSTAVGVGLHDVTTDADNLAEWKDTGDSDVHLSYLASGSGGEGVLIVEYIQNNDLTA